MTSIIAVWIFFGQQCQSIVEFGRNCRLSLEEGAIERFTTIADARWNEICARSNDYESILGVECLQAYPTHRPSVCFFAKPVTLSGSSLEILAIERSEGEAIRLQLAGTNKGFWMERRFNSDAPKPFRSGLDYTLNPQSVAKLTSNLYLVRYRD